MYFFEERYIKGFMSGYMCSLMTGYLEMAEEEPEIANSEKFKAIFPLMNDDIKKEIKTLSKDEYLEFFESHEEFFKASSLYEKTYNRAVKHLEEEKLMEQYKRVIEHLNMANIISGVNGDILVTCSYGRSNLDFYEFDDTNQRIEIAKEIMELKNHTTDEVFNLIINKNDDENILILRNDNAVLLFDSLEKMEILYARYVDTKLPWKIEKVSGTDMEQIKYIKFDEFNREIEKDYEMEDFF